MVILEFLVAKVLWEAGRYFVWISSKVNGVNNVDAARDRLKAAENGCSLHSRTTARNYL